MGQQGESCFDSPDLIDDMSEFDDAEEPLSEYLWSVGEDLEGCLVGDGSDDTAYVAWTLELTGDERFPSYSNGDPMLTPREQMEVILRCGINRGIPWDDLTGALLSQLGGGFGMFGVYDSLIVTADRDRYEAALADPGPGHRAPLAVGDNRSDKAFVGRLVELTATANERNNPNPPSS